MKAPGWDVSLSRESTSPIAKNYKVNDEFPFDIDITRMEFHIQ